MDASAPDSARKLAAAHALGVLADESELTLAQLATAWAARHPAVSSVVIGPRTMQQLEGYLAASSPDLSDDVLGARPRRRDRGARRHARPDRQHVGPRHPRARPSPAAPLSKLSPRPDLSPISENRLPQPEKTRGAELMATLSNSLRPVEVRSA